MTSCKPKIIAVVGPTASGKSDLAVKLALEFDGEIVSADSRQVYEGLDIGTGKITKHEMRGISHHLLDVASPRRAFSAAQFKKKAERAIDGILKRGKLPIVAGGTGFYVQALVDGAPLPEVKPDTKLRTRLAKKLPSELFAKLKKLDPARAKTIERENPRRLIRAIEIARAIGHTPHLETRFPNKYAVIRVGLWPSDEVLKEKIAKRNESMLKKGLIAEVRKLRAQDISEKRIRELGFEYSLPLEYIKGNLTKSELLQKMNEKTWQYAKRQRTWWKRDGRIKWFTLGDTKKIEQAVARFLEQN